MEFRHEWKIEINLADLAALRSRLRVLMQPDEHAAGGRYQIRSLYFDTPTDQRRRVCERAEITVQRERNIF